MKRIFAALLVVCCLCVCLTGCTKDEVLGSLERIVEQGGELVLTRGGRLQGERSFGADPYVGEYSADYENFDGRETLFGGTSFDRENGGSVTVKCKLEVTKGSAKLLFLSSTSEERTLIDAAGEYSGTLELPAGSNYVCFTGDGFSGSVELVIE